MNFPRLKLAMFSWPVILIMLSISISGLGAQEAEPLNLIPDFDAYVYLADGNLHEGETGLKVRGFSSHGRTTFMSFDFEMTKSVDSAFIELYAYDVYFADTPTDLQVAGIDTMFDMTLTVDNQPADDKYFAVRDTINKDQIDENTWFRWDVTEYINHVVENGLSQFSFRVDATNGSNYFTFNAKEAGTDVPQLVLYQTGGPQNLPPSVSNPVSDIEFDMDTGPYTLIKDLNTVFSDPNANDELTFSTSSSNFFILTSVAGDSLVVNYSSGAFGSGEVYLTATDQGGESVTDTFQVTVNEVLAQQKIIHPFLDGHIKKGSDGNVSMNTGSLTLKFKYDGGSFSREIYLNFDMSEIKSPIDSAFFKLYNVDVSGASGTKKLKLSGIDTVFDSDMTWNTRPADEAYTQAADDVEKGADDKAQWYIWNVTDFLNQMQSSSADSFGLRLWSDVSDASYFQFRSMEASENWQLPTLYVYSNGAPVKIGSIADQVFDEESGPHTIVQDLYTIFQDPDSDELTFKASSDDGNISASVKGDSLTVNSKDDWYGSGTVVITASDPVGEMTADTFMVTINDVAESSIAISPVFDTHWHQQQAKIDPSNAGLELRDTLDSGGWGRIVYMTFDFSMAKAIDSAFLQLYCNYVHFSGLPTELELTPIDKTFDETFTMDQDYSEDTYSALRDTIIKDKPDKSSWFTWDITEYAQHLFDQGISKFSFRIKSLTPGGNYFKFVSNENASNTPGLILYQEGGAQNLPPVVSSPIEDVTFFENSGPYKVVSDLNGVFSDPNKTFPTFSVTSSNPNINASAEGDSLVISLVEGTSGSGSVIVTATDPEGESVSDTFMVHVTDLRAGEYAINPVMDGYIQGGGTINNTSTTLIYKNSSGGWNRQVLINLDISQIDTTVYDAQFQLYCLSSIGSMSTTLELQAVEHFFSDTVSGPGLPADSVFQSAAEGLIVSGDDINQWHTWDMTDFLNAMQQKGVTQIGLRVYWSQPDGLYLKYRSMENEKNWEAPRLIAQTANNAAPMAFDLLSPVDGDTIETMESVLLSWEESVEPDDEMVSYSLHLWNSMLDTLISDLAETQYDFDGSSVFTYETQYHWAVNASDGINEVKTDTFSFFTPKAVGIEDELTNIPKEFSLSQNYPNPFNPVTTIRYGLPKVSDVKIELYNNLGQRVSILIDKKNQSAGYYTLQISSGSMASGIYYYRIVADHFTKVKKMVLLK